MNRMCVCSVAVSHAVSLALWVFAYCEPSIQTSNKGQSARWGWLMARFVLTGTWVGQSSGGHTPVRPVCLWHLGDLGRTGRGACTLTRCRRQIQNAHSRDPCRDPAPPCAPKKRRAHTAHSRLDTALHLHAYTIQYKIYDSHWCP